MNTGIKIQTRVLPGHRIEVTAPELLEGTPVEVMVVPSDRSDPPSRLDIRRMPPEERGKLLERAAERLVDYYESTAADRVEWQDGDIIE